jgi:hypothetical protein
VRVGLEGASKVPSVSNEPEETGFPKDSKVAVWLLADHKANKRMSSVTAGV